LHESDVTVNILYPDAQFVGEATLEAQEFGTRAVLSVYHTNETGAISDATWGNCDAIVCYDGIPFDEALIARLDRCRLIVRAGVGYDHISLAACARRGIPVCNTPDYGTTDVADHAIGLMLALARGIVAYHTGLKADLAAGWVYNAAPTVRRLSGQVFGVVGLGRIGTATALRAKAMGMQIMFFDPYRPTGTELALGFKRADTLDNLLSVADVVSLHTPLSEETRNLIDREAIARMKPGTARRRGARRAAGRPAHGQGALACRLSVRGSGDRRAPDPDAPCGVLQPFEPRRSAAQIRRGRVRLSLFGAPAGLRERSRSGRRDAPLKAPPPRVLSLSGLTIKSCFNRIVAGTGIAETEGEDGQQGSAAAAVGQLVRRRGQRELCPSQLDEEPGFHPRHVRRTPGNWDM
jgi:phosphoglycerate dehydrogenase-like enzyme